MFGFCESVDNPGQDLHASIGIQLPKVKRVQATSVFLAPVRARRVGPQETRPRHVGAGRHRDHDLDIHADAHVSRYGSS